ncbi:FadR family transcriptional regulator [Actinobacteria bacterium YIM 96077]|uniref:GntR family transcriptional regulator n=1 Tax=Phytoactinopolyspora halophila TaxID=1981511 RepID=A0A329R080_9ACTN|nr:FCD domain-containing protein [Phytoactinopolyspora halophila]AYY11487.1 FadR family transcriptional regulator [Actinobacteria bacterium YIM 96077]RAW18030.1 GntR family transcriptional regulator [Phytoactinopolyspora halophila]
MKAYELVLQRIEAEIAGGRLGIGARLPGERALAEDMGVSRTSVREAVRVLEAMGIVRTAVGSGPDAGALIVAEPRSPLASALRLHVATSHIPIADVVQTRILLESWAVREASGKASDGELAGVAQLLDAMDDRELSPERFHVLDAEFHVSLVAMAGNVLVSTVMAALREAIHSYVMAAVADISDWPAVANDLRAEHRAVFEAVRSGAGERAATLVAEHIDGFYRAARLR